MSFLKNLSKELEGLGLGSDDKRKEADQGKRDYPQQSHGPGYSPGSTQTYSSTPSYPVPTAQYPGQQYQSPPPQSSYSSTSAVPIYSPPPNYPAIPADWVSDFHQDHKRWYYYNIKTGQSQWEHPGYIPPRPPLPGAGGRSADGSYTGYSSGPGAVHGGGYKASYGGHGVGGYGEKEKKEKKGGHGKFLLGAAGGVAAGALLAHALHDSDSSDEENHHASYGAPVVAAPYVAHQTTYVNVEQTTHNEDLSGSDRESLHEAREEYEEALDEANSSDADSSYQEELEEAQEEYEEELEEAYEEEYED